MIRCLLMMSLMAVAMWFAPAEARSVARGCSPSNEVGWIAKTRAIQGLKSNSTPKIVRTSGSVDAAPGAPLCEGDEVRNPTDSGQEIGLRVPGLSSATVFPGQTYTVSRPNLLQLGQEALAQMDRAFSHFRSTVSRATTNHTRGACRFAPPPQPRRAFAARSWGPLVLTWPCDGERAGPWTVTVETAGQPPSRIELQTNIVALKVAACEPACRVSVTDKDGAQIWSVDVSIEEPPRSARALDDISQPAAAAIIGSRLAGTRNAAWRLQGQSLLWRTSCKIAPAGLAAARLYGLESPELICEMNEQGFIED